MRLLGWHALHTACARSAEHAISVQPQSGITGAAAVNSREPAGCNAQVIYACVLALHLHCMQQACCCSCYRNGGMNLGSLGLGWLMRSGSCGHSSTCVHAHTSKLAFLQQRGWFKAQAHDKELCSTCHQQSSCALRMHTLIAHHAPGADAGLVRALSSALHLLPSQSM